MTRENVAWMARWVLMGQPNVLPWDMLVATPEEVLRHYSWSGHSCGMYLFEDMSTHVVVEHVDNQFQVRVDPDLRIPDLPAGVVQAPTYLQLLRFTAQRMDPLHTFLRELSVLSPFLTGCARLPTV